MSSKKKPAPADSIETLRKLTGVLGDVSACLKECMTPSAVPVEWRATVVGDTDGKVPKDATVIVKERLWFDARKAASKLLKVEPGLLSVVQLPTEDRSSVAKK